MQRSQDQHLLAGLLEWTIEEHVAHVVQRGHEFSQLGVEFLQVGDDPWATR